MNLTIAGRWAYNCDNFTIKWTGKRWYSPEDLTDGLRTLVNMDSKHYPTLIHRLKQNSDTYGQLWDYQYNIASIDVKPPEEELIIKQDKPMPKPCSKVEEGIAAAQPFDGERYGFIKDKDIGVWRKPTPQEYDAELKEEAEKKKKLKKVN